MENHDVTIENILIILNDAFSSNGKFDAMKALLILKQAEAIIMTTLVESKIESLSSKTKERE